MYSLDEDLPVNDPGNQLRAKMNGTNVYDAATPTLGEVLYTACERGILPFDKLDPETALTIVRLHAVAHSIDQGPNPVDEVRRIQV